VTIFLVTLLGFGSVRFGFDFRLACHYHRCSFTCCLMHALIPSSGPVNLACQEELCGTRFHDFEEPGELWGKDRER